jgi:2-hydroxy-3-keto-5-methylthiopentenyl-1-phosphate phosphatase
MRTAWTGAPSNEERLASFWSDVTGAPLVILTDFDYTISNQDVGDLLAETLAPPSAETRRRFARGEIGTRAYWLDSMARIRQEEGERLADTVGIDPDFAGFADWCAEQRIPLAVVSDGFSFYIERVLTRHGVRPLPVFANQFVATGNLQFPHGNPACEMCGCCKAGVVRRVQAAGARVIYLGDGVSDLYAVSFADWVFAKGSLARWMTEWKAPFFPLPDWATVRQQVEAGLTAFRNGSHPGKAGLAPNPKCHFA